MNLVDLALLVRCETDLYLIDLIDLILLPDLILALNKVSGKVLERYCDHVLTVLILILLLLFISLRLTAHFYGLAHHWHMCHHVHGLPCVLSVLDGIRETLEHV